MDVRTTCEDSRGVLIGRESEDFFLVLALFLTVMSAFLIPDALLLDSKGLGYPKIRKLFSIIELGSSLVCVRMRLRGCACVHAYLRTCVSIYILSVYGYLYH